MTGISSKSELLSTSAAEKQLQRLKSQSVRLCTAFGFDTSTGGRHLFETLYNEFFTGDSLVALSVPTCDADVLSGMIKTGTSSLTISYLDASITDDTHLVGAMAAYMEGAILSSKENAKLTLDGTQPQLLVLSSNTKFSEKMIAQAWRLVPSDLKDVKRGDKVENYIQINFIEVKDDDGELGSGSSLSTSTREVLSDLFQNMETRMTSSTKGLNVNGQQVMQILSSLNSIHSTRTLNINTGDLAVFEACNEALECYVTDLTNRLKSVKIDADEILSTMESLKSTISDALDENEQKMSHDAMNGIDASSQAFKGISYRACVGTANLVGPIYKSMVDTIISRSIDNFELLLRKVPPNSQLVKGMKKVADDTRKACEAKVKLLQSEFRTLLTKTTSKKDLFATTLSSSSKSYNELIDSLLVTTGALKELSDTLNNLCKERENSLFVQGIYNPYIRSYPFPPLHVNFNYLLNPRAAAYSIKYNTLYDEHKDGAAINRADALMIPGVAQIPFDPNQQPVPRENKPWYKVLVDIYSS